jgi:outer membrane receptor for ferrienterochelin and colicin
MHCCKRLALIGAVISVTLTSPAIFSAQQSDDLQTTDIFSLSLQQLLELKIDVTGSHIKSDDFKGISPVVVITGEQLKVTGANNLIEALQKSALIGYDTFSSLNNVPDSSAIGSASVSLRGLGVDSTLILINGRRVTVSPFANNIDVLFVDLNHVPLSTVERIEILKDGASAIYGSDAIAGVVNIILRKEVKGLELNVKSGYTADGGGEENKVSMHWGKDNESTRHVLMIDLFDRAAIFRDQRDYSSSADFRSRGGFDRRSSSGYPGSFSLDSATYIEQAGQPAFAALPDAAKQTYADSYGSDVCAADAITNSSSGSVCRYDFNPSSSLTPEASRWAFSYLGDHFFSNTLSAFTELSFVNSSTTVLGAPSLANNDAFIAADNPNHPVVDLPLHPLYQLPLQIRRRLVEFGDREKEVESDHYRLVLGLEGVINGWDWDLVYSNTQTSSVEKGSDGFVNSLRLQEAIDSGLFNVFEPSANSTTAISFIETTTRRKGKSKSSGVSAKLSKDIYALREGANIVLALGVEYREDSLRDTPDAQYTRGEITGTDFTQASGGRNNTALFYEVLIPATETLDIQLATRYEHYSDFGSTTDPKIALRWTPVDFLAVRASWGTAFRAPSLVQLELGPSKVSPALVDTQRCRATADPADCNPKEYNGIIQGNPNLDPEQSTSSSVGLEWTINDDTRFNIDYWHFDVEDLISRNAQFIVNRFGLDPDFVVRGAAPVAGVPGEISFFYDTYANFGGLETDGIDVYLSYVHSNRWGTFRFTPTMSYVLNLEESRPSGSTYSNGEPLFETIDLNGEYSNPELRVELPLSWQRGQWLSSLRCNYIDSYRDNVEGGADDRRVDDWLTIDARVDYKGFEKVILSVGASNITNKKPPLAQTESIGFDPAVHSAQGRFVYGEVSYAF